MLAANHLCLQQVRVNCAQPWTGDAQGLWFFFPRHGAVELRNGPARRRVSAGDALVVHLGPEAEFISARKTDGALWCFYVAVETLFPVLAASEISRLRALADTLKEGKVYPASGRTALECHALLEKVPPQVNVHHRALLLQVVDLLLSPELDSTVETRPEWRTAGQNVRHLFEQLSVAEIASASVDELARKFNCSRRHLNRLFHAHFGYSVAGLRMEVRLLNALSLLRDPQAKIINVAAESGFNHLGLFNSCFKRRFGTNPSQWRKSHSNTPARYPNLPPLLVAYKSQDRIPD